MTTRITPAVAVAIFNDLGEILLQKRHDVNQWCIISGHVEFGETVENAVVREVWEETGLQANVVRLIGIYSSPQSQLYHYDTESVHYITSYFEAQLSDPLTTGFSNDETNALQFFPVDALPDDLAKMHPQWLSDALGKSAEAFVR